MSKAACTLLTLGVLLMPLLASAQADSLTTQPRQDRVAIKLAPTQVLWGQVPVYVEFWLPKRLSLEVQGGITHRHYVEELLGLIPLPSDGDVLKEEGEIHHRQQIGYLVGGSLAYYLERGKPSLMGLYLSAGYQRYEFRWTATSATFDRAPGYVFPTPLQERRTISKYGVFVEAQFRPWPDKPFVLDVQTGGGIKLVQKRMAYAYDHYGTSPDIPDVREHGTLRKRYWSPFLNNGVRVGVIF